MKVQLKSDFHDYYDHMLDAKGVIWRRMSKTNNRRASDFVTLAAMGLQVPLWGKVGDMPKEFSIGRDPEVVVYTDEFAHRGEGKVKINYSQAIQYHPGTLMSAYIIGIWNYASSLRYLRIGTKRYCLEYNSHGDWRSNYGESVEIKQVQFPAFLERFWDKHISHYPMVAIDFVQSADSLWAAIDLNTSPGLRHSPIEDMLSATDVADLIRGWHD